MILVLHHSQILFFQDMMQTYFKKRYQVFFERLKWDVPCEDRMERDQYDNLGPTYLIQVHHTHGVCGGVRFLPTTEPYMLKNTFGFLAKGKFKIPEDKRTIESSRFFSISLQHSESGSLISNGTYELVLAMLEYCLFNSIKKIITVTDPKITRLFKSMGWPLEVLNEKADSYTGDKIVCGMWNVTMKYAEAIREKSGIRGPVLWYPVSSEERETRKIVYPPSSKDDPLGVALLQRHGI